MPMQHFTPSDLLRLLYGDATQQEELADERVHCR